MSGSLEQAMASIRLHLEGGELLSQDEAERIGGKDSMTALTLLFNNGKIAISHCDGHRFYSLPPSSKTSSISTA